MAIFPIPPVSILVLMDSRVKTIFKDSTGSITGCFNPCFNGQQSKNDSDYGAGTITLTGFNPCFNGQQDKNLSCQMGKYKFTKVSILVLMDSRIKIEGKMSDIMECSVVSILVLMDSRIKIIRACSSIGNNNWFQSLF